MTVVRTRVLVVEDDDGMAQALAWMIERDERLEHVGHCRTVACVIEAFDEPEVWPDVVLLDHRLPDGDGLDVLRRLRATEPRPRVVLLTSEDRVQEQRRLQQAGADVYLVKGVASTEEIRAALLPVG